MKQEQIKILIDAMANSGLSEMEFSEDGWRLRLVKRASRPERGASGKTAASTSSTSSASAASLANGKAASGDCMAPLYGVVHLQPSPGEPSFVQVGQHIAAGQTLCVIEAMKVFNEVRAEREGTIAEVLVSSGEEVEAGQPLFRLA